MCIEQPMKSSVVAAVTKAIVEQDFSSPHRLRKVDRTSANHFRHDQQHSKRPSRLSLGAGPPSKRTAVKSLATQSPPPPPPSPSTPVRKTPTVTNTIHTPCTPLSTKTTTTTTTKSQTRTPPSTPIAPPSVSTAPSRTSVTKPTSPTCLPKTTPSTPTSSSSTLSSCSTSSTCTTSSNGSTGSSTNTTNIKPTGINQEPSKTTAILDWDDTICPSTHLASLGLRVDDPSALPLALQRQLEQLESAVINIMEEAMRFGKVVVITNAEAGWVELSGRRFLPRVVSFLNNNDIRIVSARTCFESDFPDAPSSWKMAAFSQEVAVMFPDDDELNVLVLGDSMSERDAAHALSTRLPNSRVKTVKFVERPSIDQLMRQVQLVAQSLPDLATYASSFDVDLVVSASV